jgi:HEXXH motif-containing protein
VRLLGLRAWITAQHPSSDRVRAELEEDGHRALARAGEPDVLPRLLCLAGGVLSAEECLAGIEAVSSGSGAPRVQVASGVHLALEDTNPLRDIEAHPGKDGNTLDLGGRAPDVWVAALRAALDAIDEVLPEWSSGIRPFAMSRFVPVGYDPVEHRSASFREAPGLAYLSLHPDPLTMAEAIMHEAQHSALNLLSWFDPLLTNDPAQLAASPLRPDPRPLLGVLLAAHAFVPVAALHLRLASRNHPLSEGPRFAERRAEVCAANTEALEVLEAAARPTTAGARVLQDLRVLHDAVAPSIHPLP